MTFRYSLTDSGCELADRIIRAQATNEQDHASGQTQKPELDHFSLGWGGKNLGGQPVAVDDQYAKQAHYCYETVYSLTTCPGYSCGWSFLQTWRNSTWGASRGSNISCTKWRIRTASSDGNVLARSGSSSCSGIPQAWNHPRSKVEKSMNNVNLFHLGNQDGAITGIVDCLIMSLLQAEILVRLWSWGHCCAERQSCCYNRW